MNKPSELYIGLMSGTSLDAIDAVLVDFSEALPQVVCAQQNPLSAALKAEILALQSPSQRELNRAMRLHRELGQKFAESVNALLADAPRGPFPPRAQRDF